MIGTLLNVLGIIIGGVVGLWRKAPLSPSTDSSFRVFLGAFTVWYGLRLTWLSFNGTFLQIMKQLAIAIVAMMLGKLLGQLLRLQELSNRMGRHAKEQITRAGQGERVRTGEALTACAALFCAAPLAWLGAVQDGLTGYFFPLAIKGVMEGLAMVGFIQIFGWAAMLSALPVLAFQGSITLITLLLLRPFLEQLGLVHSVNAVGGLLVFSVALIILNLKKIPLAGYIPSLAIAPLLTWILG